MNRTGVRSERVSNRNVFPASLHSGRNKKHDEFSSGSVPPCGCQRHGGLIDSLTWRCFNEAVCRRLGQCFREGLTHIDEPSHAEKTLLNFVSGTAFFPRSPSTVAAPAFVSFVPFRLKPPSRTTQTPPSLAGDPELPGGIFSQGL